MVVWDDQKIGDYPFQTEYSYRMNQLSRKRWLTYNVIGGCILGALMAWMVFVVSDHYFSDPARMMIAVLIGVWPTKFMEKRAERTTKAAQAAMAAARRSALSARAMWRSSISAALRMLAGLAYWPSPSSIMRGAEPWMASNMA